MVYTAPAYNPVQNAGNKQDWSGASSRSSVTYGRRHDFPLRERQSADDLRYRGSPEPRAEEARVSTQEDGVRALSTVMDLDRKLNMVEPSNLKRFLASYLGLHLIGFGGLLLWAYWPTLMELVRRWTVEPQYSHGYLVPVFAAVILWMRSPQWAGATSSRWGLLVLLLGGALRFAATYLYFDWLEGFSLLVCLAGLALFLGGRKGIQVAWPAIAFLVFMIPLPFRLEMFMSAPLRRLATGVSTYSLQTLGFSAFSEGNIIFLNDTRLGIEEACSGLSMLLIFFALSSAVAFFLQRPPWEKLLVVLSAVPIAVIANVVRIVVTGVLHETAGRELADLVFHDLAGWFMMPLALALMFVELKFLSRLMVTPRFVPTTGVPRLKGKKPVLPAPATLGRKSEVANA